MTKEKSNVVAKKKVYKKPAPVQSVESGKILQSSCSGSCGVQVSWASNPPCGK